MAMTRPPEQQGTTTTIKADTKKYLLPIGMMDPVLVKGQGVTVWDIDGRAYLDFVAASGALNTGHCHPAVVDAISAQAGELMHSSGSSYNVPAVRTAAKLAEIAPKGLEKSFFCNSGAEAVDNAVKIAKAYCARVKKTPAIGLLSLTHGFHGRLALPLSLTGQPGGKLGMGSHAIYPGVIHLPAPYCYRCPFQLTYPVCDIACATYVKDVFKYGLPGDAAAVIVEPILGMGGVIVPPDGYHDRIQAVCREMGTLLIVDEVFTGFGRTGRMFASEHWNLAPDIMTIAKTVGGGLPLGAVMATETVAAGLRSGDLFTTFGLNSLVALRAGLAAIGVIQAEGLIANSARMGERLLAGLRGLQKDFPCIGDVRGKGLFIGAELVEDPVTKVPASALTATVVTSLRAKGVLLTAAGSDRNVLRITPPLVVTAEHVDRFIGTLGEVLSEIRDAPMRHSKPVAGARA